MPFLHGFRRIVYEYQPLVDAVLCVVGLEGDKDAGDGSDNAEEESVVCRSLVELLEKESQSDVFSEGISYALFKIAERGLVSAAQILLRYGADLNFEDPVSYYNPLHIAVLRNRPAMVETLIRHGADMDKRDRIHKSSPLDLASEELERLPCLRVLLDLGASVNARDQNGKTAVLHALASSDGLTVHNTENIRLLLERGADVRATTEDGETVVSSLVFLVKEALDGTAEDASEIGRFCMGVTRLLLAHGVEPSGCHGEDGDEGDGEPGLTQTCLEYFDLLFPLAVLLLQSGASFHCTRHGPRCWAGHVLLFRRLSSALWGLSDREAATELFNKTETLLDLALVTAPLTPRLDTAVLEQEPRHQGLLELYGRLRERDTSPPSLRAFCRAFIRRHLQPWPLESKVNSLPLPDSLKEYLLPERRQLTTCEPSFRPHHTLR